MSIYEIILSVVIVMIIIVFLRKDKKTNEKISSISNELSKKIYDNQRFLELAKIDFKSFIKKYNEQYEAAVSQYNQLKDSNLIHFSEVQEKISTIENMINDVELRSGGKLLSYIEQTNTQFKKIDQYLHNVDQTLDAFSQNNVDQLRDVVDFLSKKLESIKKENEELRKKLEHFSEISDDSSMLNIAVDTDKENELINSILKKKDLLRVSDDKLLEISLNNKENNHVNEPNKQMNATQSVAASLDNTFNNRDTDNETSTNEDTLLTVISEEKPYENSHDEVVEGNIQESMKVRDYFTDNLEILNYHDIEDLHSKIELELKAKNNVYIRISKAYTRKEYVNTTQKITSITSVYSNKSLFYIRFEDHNIATTSISQYYREIKRITVQSDNKDYFKKIDIVYPKELTISETKQVENIKTIDVHLDPQQEFAFNLMENSKSNLFISGKAGTGKSFLLKVFAQGTTKKHILVAPTGIAALNVNGVTLHSTFGFDNLKLDNELDFIKLKSEKKELLKQVEVIIIDEISMVRADVLDKIDLILRKLNNSNKVFGGKQVFIFGDLFQLPPIARGTELEFLLGKYQGIFFFHSNAYKEGDFKFVELSNNHRQEKDQTYFKILNNIREGNTTQEDINLLNSRYVKNQDLRRVLKLFPKKAQVEKINNDELNRINAKEYQFDASIEFSKGSYNANNIDGLFPISMNLKLKLGALIMMVKNDLSNRWVNGTLGIVSYISNDILRVTINRIEYTIEKEFFESKEAKYQDGKIHYDTVLRVKQYPLVLAYAITIHKSQGMTYQNVACDLTETFASGQSYVALSRCVSLGGLHLLEKITGNEIATNSEIVFFYEEVNNVTASS